MQHKPREFEYLNSSRILTAFGLDTLQVRVVESEMSLCSLNTSIAILYVGYAYAHVCIYVPAYVLTSRTSVRGDAKVSH